MAEQEQDPLWDEMQSWIGKSLSVDGPSLAPDPVNQPMIHHWIDAFDDRNPVYEQKNVASASRFGDIVAPQAMMPAWTMARAILEGIAERGGSGVEMSADNPLRRLDDSGFNGTLATNSELQFERPLRLGDELQSDTILESISVKKKTGLGQGYFVTWVNNYTDQHGELVGRQIFRVFKFNPHALGA